MSKRDNMQEFPPFRTNFQRFLKISRLGLEKSEKWFKISHLGLISVSKKHFTEVSVSSWSRKNILQKYRSRLSLETKNKLILSLGLDLEISLKRSLGLVSVLPNVVSSNSVCFALPNR